MYIGKENTAIKGANVLLTGNCMMLSKTNLITFPARVVVENGKLNDEAKLKIDRTK